MKISSTFSSVRMTRTFLSAAITVLILAPVCNLQAQRLPSTVRPEHYSLTLTPNLTAATFSGVESIEISTTASINAITLNSAEIAFQSVTVSAGGKKQTATVTLDEQKQQATFTFPEKLPAGKSTLAINYTGILNNELRGFYLSKTERRNYAVTQFEPTDARRAFPSFDEPAFKATYDVSLVVDANDTAISNSPIATDTPGPAAGKHTLKFLPTPKMSTYLVAFLVGDFKCSTGEQDGVTIRSCATPDKVALTPYSVDVAKYILHYYNTYFGIPYPLKKLDLIALPDFEAGAMENFGAITYRETALLLDEKNASVGAKKEVALVVAHEMAHQWFGDLVTMQWWDNIWLNEGFATWMENKPLESMHPEWNIDEAVISDMDNTLNLDSQPTTRAIRAKADTPDEINQMFDGIAYGKAGAVLLSVENYLGAETFRKGVHNYLAAHLYSNATAEDFWGAQTANSHKPVDKIMESLVAQPGEPLITLGEPAAGKVSIAQRRFFLSPGIQPDPAQKWMVPVCFKTGESKQDCEVLSPNDTALKVPADKMFFANAGGKGYYRTAYPASSYTALVSQIETGLTPAERISLIGDEWAQVRANKSPIGAYLDLVAAVKADPNTEVVAAALGGFESAYDRLAATPQEKEALEAWVRNTFAPVYAKLGPPSDNDSPNTRELRAELFGTLGLAKDPAVLAESRQVAAKYIADPASVDATFARTALAIAARNGNAELFDQLQKVYETSTNPEEQIGALRLLAEFEDPALVQRSLDYALSGKVRNQDAAIQLAIPLQSDETRDLTWKYIQSHWDKVKTELTTNSGSILVGSAAAFCSDSGRDDVQTFFSTHKVAASDQALKHSIERINGCIEFRSLQEPKLKQWLETQTGQ
jgi:aminopeptidase N/puromycin-sensitive aminopeptidase